MKDQLALLSFGGDSCEVWDYWGNKVHEGTRHECEEYILDHEGEDTHD